MPWSIWRAVSMAWPIAFEGVVDGQRELLRAVSHELRTPLARIFFLLNQLKSDRVSGDQNADIQRIERSVYELNDLVEELMDFARLDRDISHRMEIDVYAQMRELREMVAELRRDISVDIDSEHLVVWANKTHFKRALTNLVTNAVRHAESHIWITGKKWMKWLISVWKTMAAVFPNI